MTASASDTRLLRSQAIIVPDAHRRSRGRKRSLRREEQLGSLGAIPKVRRSGTDWWHYICITFAG